MPIISASIVQNNTYRLTVTLGHGNVENVVVTSNGKYDVCYVKDGKALNRTGRIVNVVQNRVTPNNSYILFDWSEDQSSRKERIHFYQIQNIIDVTPNDAYAIALQHGFVGSVTDWLESMRGDPGKDPYELAVDSGFEGTKEEWFASLKGERGFSAYEIACRNGYEGTEKEWLISIRGDSAYDIAVKNGFKGTEAGWLESLKGKSSYEIAKEYGFTGTEEEWMAQNGDVTALKKVVDQIVIAVKWKTDMT